MTITVVIGTVFPEHVGEELVGKLKAVHDEEPENRWFRCMLPQDDPRMKEILRLLDEAGLRPWTEFGERDKRKEYQFRLIRHYSVEDLRQADYLQLRPALYFDASRDVEGRIEVVRPEQLPKEGDFAHSIDWFVASHRVRRLIEAAELRHVAFRPLALLMNYDEVEFCRAACLEAPPLERQYYSAEAEDAWWEITSDLEMPPLDMPLYDGWSRPIRDRDFSRGCHLKEGHYADPQLHYAASSLAGMPEFDLARTSEPFGSSALVTGHLLIASQRFFEFCLQHSLQTEWVPVWVHKDGRETGT